MSKHNAMTQRRSLGPRTRRTAALSVAAVVASGAAADAAPLLAAPGDCAQPIREVDTGPLHALPAGGVAGPPAAHLAPIAVGEGTRLVPDLSPQSSTASAAPAPSLLETVGQLLGISSSPPNSSASVLPSDPTSLVPNSPSSLVPSSPSSVLPSSPTSVLPSSPTSVVPSSAISAPLNPPSLPPQPAATPLATGGLR